MEPLRAWASTSSSALLLVLLSSLSGGLLTLVLLWAQLLPSPFLSSLTLPSSSSTLPFSPSTNCPAISRPFFSKALYPPVPRLPFTNFTVDSLLPPSRWPSLVSPTQPRLSPPPHLPPDADPFLRGSPHRFSGVRGAVVSLFTPHQSELGDIFPDNDRNFFSTMADHSDLILFYIIYPYDSEAEVHSVLQEKLHCSELTDRGSLGSRNASSSDLYARLQHPAMQFPQRLEGIREFLSPLGTHIITVPIAVHLPRWLAADPANLMRPDWLGCHGARRSLEYNLFSGSVFSHQLLFHPILRGYDYWIKHDLDVHWKNTPPAPSIFQSMQQQGCVWMHTEYNGYGTDCGLDAPEVVEDWAERAYGRKPASYGTTWWGSTDYFYGNLLGGWLGWYRSEENRQLADFMYEDPTRPAYFTHRWGDQPPYAKSLGMSEQAHSTQQRQQYHLRRTTSRASAIGLLCASVSLFCCC